MLDKDLTKKQSAIRRVVDERQVRNSWGFRIARCGLALEVEKIRRPGICAYRVRRNKPLNENARQLMKQNQEVQNANEVHIDALVFCKRPHNRNYGARRSICVRTSSSFVRNRKTNLFIHASILLHHGHIRTAPSVRCCFKLKKKGDSAAARFSKFTAKTNHKLEREAYLWQTHY